MKPADFLALVQSTAATAQRETSDTLTGAGDLAGARLYAAVSISPRTLPFITFHPGAEFHALPYSTLQFVSGDDRGFTFVRLVFQRMAVMVQGRQLAPVVEAIRTHTAAHLFQFDGGRHDPPEPGAPVILALEFLPEKAKGTAGGPRAG